MPCTMNVQLPAAQEYVAINRGVGAGRNQCMIAQAQTGSAVHHQAAPLHVRMHVRWSP